MFRTDELVLVTGGDDRGFLNYFAEIIREFRLPFIRKIILVDSGDFLFDGFGTDLALEKDLGSKRGFFFDDAIEKMFRADVVMVQILRNPLGGDEGTLGPA